MAGHPSRVLVLGGTADGAEVAGALAAAGCEVTYSLAGRTAQPRVPPAPVVLRTGGFGGESGLVEHCRAHVDLLVDATHPFAHQMSAHASAAGRMAGVPVAQLVRPGWLEGPGDDWRRVGDLGSAADLAPTLGQRVLLTIGRQGLARFAADHVTTYVVRSVEPPAALPANFDVILEQGPFTLEHERDLLRDKEIDVIVTKDSGGTATAAKLTAARERGIPVVVVDRPPLPPATVALASVSALVAWVVAQSG